MYSIILTLSSLLITSTTAQLTRLVPPPACLRICLENYGRCSLCTPEGTTVLESCVFDTCAPKDETYASTYLASICPEGGYMTFESQVSTFIAIPVENCTKIECSPSTPSPTSIPSPEPTAFGPVESGEVAEDGNGNGGGEEDKDEEAGNSRKSKRELTRGFVA